MDFSDQILKWYKTHQRDLPWRHTRDAYKIWLSEVILQQTRVDQGTAYYQKFVERFPEIKDLAEAPEQEVLKLWQGLGYYSRARNLHHAANQLMNDYKGIFPDTYEEIRTLKGVGEYTAAAIASIAFGEPEVVVDGNVKRVLARIFGLEDVSKKLYTRSKEIMEKELDHERAGDFNQAVMEFGALQCTPQSPSCTKCVFKSSCFAYSNDMVDRLPVRETKKKPRKRYFSYFVLHPQEKSIVLSKRSDDDIWKNLFEFPLIETTSEANAENLLQEPDFISWFGNKAGIAESSKTFKHQLSHQTIYARYHVIDHENIELPREWIVVSIEELENYPVSRLIEKYFDDSDL